MFNRIAILLRWQKDCISESVIKVLYWKRCDRSGQCFALINNWVPLLFELSNKVLKFAHKSVCNYWGGTKQTDTSCEAASRPRSHVLWRAASGGGFTSHYIVRNKEFQTSKCMTFYSRTAVYDAHKQLLLSLQCLLATWRRLRGDTALVMVLRFS